MTAVIKCGLFYTNHCFMWLKRENVAYTRQVRSLPIINDTKQKVSDTQDPLIILLDSLTKLEAEIEDFEKIAEKYFEDINIQLKNQEENT